MPKHTHTASRVHQEWGPPLRDVPSSNRSLSRRLSHLDVNPMPLPSPFTIHAPIHKQERCSAPTKRDPHSPRASDHEKPPCPTNLPAERRLAARSRSVLHSLISCAAVVVRRKHRHGQDYGMDGWMEKQKRRRQDGWMTDPPSRKPAPPSPNANPINNNTIDTICNHLLLVVFMLLASASLAILVNRPQTHNIDTLTVDRSF